MGIAAHFFNAYEGIEVTGFKPVLSVLCAFVIVFTVAACGGDANNSAKKRVDQAAKKLAPFLPKNDVEFHNYNRAQQLYDSPDTIIWCSTTWGNTSAPIVTVPVAGKLTSSSTTFFNPVEVINNDDSGSGVATPARSVDKLFHPDPPKYRYGFTPGGQYVDFFEMPTFCTTALTKFQRQSTEVALTVDEAAEVAQRAAERALARGDQAGAQAILEGAIR